MYNWNNLSNYKHVKSLFYEYFKWQKYDSYLNLFYSKSSDVLGGESLEFDEVIEFFENNNILLNIESYYPRLKSDKILYQVRVYNHINGKTYKNKDKDYSERENAQIFAIDTALICLEENLSTNNNNPSRFKNERNVENNFKEFFK